MQLLRLSVGYAQNPANTLQCTKSGFLHISTDMKVLEICEKLKRLPYDKEHKEERQNLKKQLPAFCFNSKRFKDNYRKNENAVPSGLCMIDWDDIARPDEWLASFGATTEEQKSKLKLCGLSGLHISASRHGFHGLICMRKGETIEQAQERVARFMGKEDYDKGAHALSQLSYAVPFTYWLFLEEDILFDTEEAQEEEATSAADEALPTAQEEPHNEHIEEAVVVYEEKLSEQQDAYDGVPMPLIINAIIYDLMKLDKAPAEGTRNNRYFELMGHLRYFCDFDAELMLKVAPDWGLPEEERRNICLRAVSMTV